MFSDVKMRPHFKDGRPDGLRLRKIGSNSLYKTMGFENGDITTSADGEKVMSPDGIQILFNILKTKNQIILDIKRKDKPKVMSFIIIEWKLILIETTENENVPKVETGEETPVAKGGD